MKINKSFYIWKMLCLNLKNPYWNSFLSSELFSSWQSPAALSNLSKIPCRVKGTSSAASPLSGQALQERAGPIQQSLPKISQFGEKQQPSLTPFTEVVPHCTSPSYAGLIFACMSILKHCPVCTDFFFYYVSLKISLEDSPGHSIKKGDDFQYF